jgi:hypothetical protein
MVIRGQRLDSSQPVLQGAADAMKDWDLTSASCARIGRELDIAGIEGWATAQKRC